MVIWWGLVLECCCCFFYEKFKNSKKSSIPPSHSIPPQRYKDNFFVTGQRQNYIIDVNSLIKPKQSEPETKISTISEDPPKKLVEGRKRQSEIDRAKRRHEKEKQRQMAKVAMNSTEQKSPLLDGREF